MTTQEPTPLRKAGMTVITAAIAYADAAAQLNIHVGVVEFNARAEASCRAHAWLIETVGKYRAEEDKVLADLEKSTAGRDVDSKGGE